MAFPSCKKTIHIYSIKKSKASSQQKIKNYAVGVFPRFYELKFIWCAKVGCPSPINSSAAS
ncbi:hypothetical protein IGI04_015949 [Brassica rapa subsp. trilocularis]|uniref:Uncharacterized protein n=1 Tax=Brassica rapa subsp. trilocularis TaxID=1813537 RepID=A0ABQ7MRI9_BRACM|nr:hypothetical protein IGI04_015949 [Brassica rapa subsp. trilocularis]